VAWEALSQKKHKVLGHHGAMKHRRLAGLLLSFQLLLVGVPTALAHETASPTPFPTVTPLSELEQYKLALEKYRVHKNLYLRYMQLKSEISKTLLNAVNRANSIAKKAAATAKNDSARKLIDTQLKIAIDAANSAWEEAMAALGPQPLDPVEPVKPSVTATVKKNKVSKPSPTPSP